MPERPEQDLGVPKGRWVAPTLFLGPLVTSAASRLTWLFLLLTAVALIVPYLRRGNDWRPSDLADQRCPASSVGRRLRPSRRTLGRQTERCGRKFCPPCGRDFDRLRRKQSDSSPGRAAAQPGRARLRRRRIYWRTLCPVRIAHRWRHYAPGRQREQLVQAGECETRQDASTAKSFEFDAAEFRQSTALLAFHLWPALLALSAFAGRARRATWIGLLVVAISIPILLSDRMSSQLALVSSLIVFSLACIWRRRVVHVLAALWCLGFVLILPAAFLAYKADLHLASWVPKSARARMIIWEFTAERVLERPWLGIGAGSTPALQIPRGEAEQPEGFVYPRTTSTHAHDLFLQTWFELGLGGSILIAIAGRSFRATHLSLAGRGSTFRGSDLHGLLGHRRHVMEHVASVASFAVRA